MADGMLETMAADIAAIKAMLEGGATAGAAAPTAETPKPTRTRTPKADKPTFTAEELRDKFLEVQSKHGDAAAKQLIADCGLAKLIADTSTWQASYDAAVAKLAEDADDEGEDNGGL
jgi:hypothetical protein